MLQIDRFASLYLVSPLRMRSSKGAASIPILMYHSVSEVDESGRPAYYRIATPPSLFANQMEYLRQSGYRTCTTAQALELLRSGAASATKAVVITFDDGYLDFYTAAFPILNSFGLSATVFLPTGFIGDTTMQFNARDCLSWPQVREMQKYGIAFGSHTVSHPRLHGLDKRMIESEVTRSREAIQEKTGEAVDTFAYPYAFPQVDRDFKTILRDILTSAGYRNGVCTTVGRVRTGSDRMFLARLPVNGSDDSALFEAKLDGAYDWVGGAQLAFKKVRSLFG